MRRAMVWFAARLCCGERLFAARCASAVKEQGFTDADIARFRALMLEEPVK